MIKIITARALGTILGAVVWNLAYQRWKDAPFFRSAREQLVKDIMREMNRQRVI